MALRAKHNRDPYVLAKQRLSASAVEAVAAHFGIICRDSVANRKVGDAGPDGGDDADSFVAGDKREFGNELALVDMLTIGVLVELSQVLIDDEITSASTEPRDISVPDLMRVC